MAPSMAAPLTPLHACPPLMEGPRLPELHARVFIMGAHAADSRKLICHVAKQTLTHPNSRHPFLLYGPPCGCPSPCRQAGGQRATW